MVGIIFGAAAGFITSALGVGWFDGDLALAAMINIPVCVAGFSIDRAINQ